MTPQKQPQQAAPDIPRAVVPGADPAVAERLISEGLISLVTAAAMLPPVRGKRVSTSSIFRWIVRGKHGVKLEAVKISGEGFWVSKPALARFAAALTNRATPST